MRLGRISTAIGMLALVSTAVLPAPAAAGWTRTCVHGTTAHATSLIPGKIAAILLPDRFDLYLTGQVETTLNASVPITFLSKIRKLLFTAKRVGTNVQIERVRLYSAHNLTETITGNAVQLTGSDWESKTLTTTATDYMYSSVDVAIDVKATPVGKMEDTYRFSLSQVCVEYAPQIGFP